MSQSKILSLIGIAARGRNMVSGEFSTENAIKDGTAELILVASDASANTQKKFKDKSSFYEIPIYIYGNKEQLGKAIGKDQRSSIAITDFGLAKAIMKHLDEENH